MRLGAKLMLAGLLAAAAIAFYPQVQPLVGQGLPYQKTANANPAAPPKSIQYLEKVEDLILDLTNQARLAQGLAPLVKDEDLRRAARDFSNDMLVRRFFDHTTPEGLSFDDRLEKHYPHRVRALGENIWSGSGYDPGRTQALAKEIVNDWLNSPDHRENLLDPDFTHLGVGVSARRDSIRATQEFVGRSRLWPWRI